jgi:glycosyltransferase involved in cell wall biosynthesis
MISLIVTTRHRTEELHRLLASLEAQSYKAFEVIVVDQNKDKRLVDVLAQHNRLNIRHLESGAGASRGRNVGLRDAVGDIIAFPDDDCWYPEHLLASVVDWFEEHTGFDGLVTAIRSPKGRLMLPKFAPRRGPTNRNTVIRCLMAVNMFLRIRLVKAVGLFREGLGPGSTTPYHSGEDLDYGLRASEKGRLWYEPELTVYHPELNTSIRLGRTNYSYALSVGYIWREHRFPWYRLLGDLMLRSISGAAYHLCKGNLRASYAYLNRAAGQFCGYALPPAEVPMTHTASDDSR